MAGSDKPQTFYEVLTDAVNDLTENGYSSEEQLEGWLAKLRAAAYRSLTPTYVLEAELRNLLTTTYKRLVEKGGIFRYHPGVEKFTLAKVKPKLRAELDRRILASANLIKLNRTEAIETTLRRFSGWSTSIPPGGTEATKKVQTKTDIRKSLSQLSFVERRVAIDQGHKFVANLNDILAEDGGAIAAEWHSHWRQGNYNYRKDHKERDEKVYLIRGNWASQQGLVRASRDGYFDEITKPAEEVYCRCFATYIYSPRRLPRDMLTDRGAEKFGLREAA